MSNSELMKNRHTMEINAICSELVIFETATNNSKYLFIFHLKFEDTEEEKYQQQLLLSVITIHDTLKEE